MISSIAGWRWKAWPLPGGIVTRTSISCSAAVRPARDSQSCGPQGEGSTTASAAVTKRNGSSIGTWAWPGNRSIALPPARRPLLHCGLSPSRARPVAERDGLAALTPGARSLSRAARRWPAARWRRQPSHCAIVAETSAALAAAGPGRGRAGARSDRQQLVDAFGEQQVQRPLPVGRALLRVQPDVVRQLLDVDERADRILDERDLVGGARLREEQQAAERLHLVADAVAGHQQPRLGAADAPGPRPTRRTCCSRTACRCRSGTRRGRTPARRRARAAARPAAARCCRLRA